MNEIDFGLLMPKAYVYDIIIRIIYIYGRAKQYKHHRK